MEKKIEGVLGSCLESSEAECASDIPLEISARHVHLTKEAAEMLFGCGAMLNNKKSLSQPGEFLSDKRVKLVTAKGEIDGAAVLGPYRKAVQVELSASDCRRLGICAPVNISGDLRGAGDVIIIGEKGVLEETGCVIIAKAHIHMTPGNAAIYGVSCGQYVSVSIDSKRPVTLHEVMIRVDKNYALALHIDTDEANACLASSNDKVIIQK